MGGASGRALPVAAAALWSAATVAADPVTDALDALAPGWSVSGALSARFDVYGRSGPAALSVFPQTGPGGYAEAFARFSRRLSDYETLTGDLQILVEEHDYRSPEDGLVVERARLEWEKGDAGIPLRVTGGDFFAFLSPATIQTSLKGASVELQRPVGQRPGAVGSLLLFSGVQEATYRDLAEDPVLFSGGSLLLQDPSRGALALNLVHHWRDAAPGIRERSQVVGGVAIERPFRLEIGRASCRERV